MDLPCTVIKINMHTEEMLPKQVTGKVQVNILMKIISNVIFPQYCII